MNTPRMDYYGEEKPRRSILFFASATFIALIVVAGLVIGATKLFGKDEPNTSENAVTAPTPSKTTSKPSSDTDCPRKPEELTGTVLTAPEAEWQLLGTIAVPSNPEAGPFKIDSDGYRSCFARTPQGALLAATNYFAAISNPQLTLKLRDRNVAVGPGRDALKRSPVPTSTVDPVVRTQVAGFKIDKYDGNDADVNLAIRGSNGALLSFVFNLRWEQGEWKAMVTESGGMTTPLAPLPNLFGYIAWSGA